MTSIFNLLLFCWTPRYLDFEIALLVVESSWHLNFLLLLLLGIVLESKHHLVDKSLDVGRGLKKIIRTL